MSSSEGKVEPGPMPRNPQELEACLIGMTIPDTAQVKKAEATLRAFLKTAEGVDGFLQQLAGSQRVEARQVAGVLLRKKLWGKFKKMPDQKKDMVKKMLLERLVAEPARPVRIAIAALCASIAKRLIPDDQWKELLPFLLQMSKSERKEHREVAMILFRALADNIPEDLAPHFRTLLQVFHTGLKDPEPAVALEALRSIGILTHLVDPEDDSPETKKAILAFRDVVPDMVHLVRKFLEKGDEQAAELALDVFNLLSLTPIAVLTPHMPLLSQMMLACCAHKQLDINLRHKAGDFLASICNSYAAKLQKSGLVEEILKVGVALAVETCEDEWDSSSMTPHTIAVEFLDALVLNVPRKLVFGPLMGTVEQLLKSERADDRKGAMVIMSILAEGCAEQYLENLEAIVKTVCARCKDPAANVRAGACVALVQVTEATRPDILDLHNIVIPHVLLGLRDPNEDPSVKKRLLTALHNFVSSMEENILPYLPQIMETAKSLLSSTDKDVQGNAIYTIGACALAAKEKFAPFYKESISLMGQLMTQKGEEQLHLRTKATEASGCIARAVGKEMFQPLLPQFLKMSMEGMALEFFELREATFRMWAHWAEMLGKELEPLLPTIISFILASMQSADGVEFQNVLGKDELDDGLDKLDSDDDANDAETINRKVRLSIRSSALEEKIAAINCMGVIIEQCEEKYLPFAEKSLSGLEDLQEYTHEYIRYAVVNTLRELVHMYSKVFPNPKGVQRGVNNPVHKTCKDVINKAIPVFVDRLVEEEDKKTAGAATEALVALCRDFGLGGIKAHMKDILDATMMFLKEKAPCQTGAILEGEDAPDEVEQEHDEYVIDSVTDLVSALAFTMGAEFSSPFHKMVQPLLKFTSAKRAAFDRSMSWGCFAEVAMEMEAAFIPLLPQLFPLVIKALEDPSPGVRRNAAFCVGTFAALGPQASAFYAASLPALGKLYAIPAEEKGKKADIEEFKATKDNACSAVAKMIMTAPQALPLEDCIKMLLAGMPLLEDFQETKPVYTCLLKLFQDRPQMMFPHVATVMNILAQVLGDQEFPEEVMASLVSLAKALMQDLASKNKLQPILEAMQPQHRENFLKHTTGQAPTSPSPASPSAKA